LRGSAFIFWTTALMPASAASAASPSFLAVNPSRTVASSSGLVTATSEDPALRDTPDQDVAGTDLVLAAAEDLSTAWPIRRVDCAERFAGVQWVWRRKGRRPAGFRGSRRTQRNGIMNNIIWIVGAVVIVLFILGFFGLR
jgi:hypothetical protein